MRRLWNKLVGATAPEQSRALVPVSPAAMVTPEPTAGTGADPPSERYFETVALDDLNDPHFINATPYQNKAQTPMPADVRQLQGEINSMERMLNLLFDDDVDSRREYFGRLRDAAIVGFCDCNIENALGNIDDVKGVLTTTGFAAVRARYWQRYCRVFFCFLLFFGVPGGLIYYGWAGGWFDTPAVRLLVPAAAWPLVIAFFWIPAGATLGIFSEFFLRTTDEISKYDELKGINQGRWNVKQRVINILVTAYLFAFLLAIGIVQIGVGNILLNDFATTRPYLSPLVGFVTGFAFPYVRDVIYRVKPAEKAAS